MIWFPNRRSEFTLFLRDIPSMVYAKNISKKICSLFKDLLLGEIKPFDISGSIGISMPPNHGSNFDEQIAVPDIALYHTKDLGKDCYCRFH
ncbi:diguanylate cyclase domain-containing protein [Anaerosporobacter sp.]